MRWPTRRQQFWLCVFLMLIGFVMMLAGGFKGERAVTSWGTIIFLSGAGYLRIFLPPKRKSNWKQRKRPVLRRWLDPSGERSKPK